MPKRISRVSYETLLRALRYGHTREAACAIAGISRATFYNRLRADEQFKARVEDAEALAVSAAETCILEAIRGGDTKVAMWWLERRCSDYAANKPREMDGYSIEILAPPDDGSVPYKVYLRDGTKP